MIQKTTLKSFYSFLLTYLFTVNFGFGQIITFDFAGNVGDEISVDSNSHDPFLSYSTITRGSGLVRRIKSDRFNSSSWAGTNIENAVVGNRYVQFTISPASGYEFEVTGIIVNIQRSRGGLSGIALRSSIDGYATNIDSEKAIADIYNNTEVVTFIVNQPIIATATTYRIYGWAEAGTGFGGFEGAGNDIIINGTVSIIPPCSAIPIIWHGSTWSNVIGPDLSTPAIIATDYDTATFGSFSACSLTVDTDATLTINDVDNGSDTNDYVLIQNDVIIDGTIAMDPKAAFVQLNDLGTVLGTGTARVVKETAPMNAWHEYTYWSSPVVNPQIGAALPESEPSRRFLFNAKKFLDATAETDNNNAKVDDQDDIDDNGDDWQPIAANTPMEPGVGYATTLTKEVYNSALGSHDKRIKAATFEGLFNNGHIEVPIYRNDFERDDTNWNLIGNPYPSAIDADLFLDANNNLDGAIYLWSQNTGPTNTANGNQVLNFSDADYAIINGLGETAGGDGLKPERKIPSGQAFFISYSDAVTPLSITTNTDAHDIAQGIAIFNNSMRVMGAADNSQFFKGSSSKNNKASIANKLWLNLTSDTGVFNQTLVGYLDAATNTDDGMYYDAPKNISTSKSAILYSIIENSTKKFAIQGKAANSLNLEESIQLGFKTGITTPYSLSIAQLQGDFLTGNTIYLKDNLLNKTHDLSASNYTFTSAVGEFNNRFEIVFTNNSTLSTNDVLVNNNTLKIIDLEDDQVQFTVSENLKIQAVAIFDVLGRQLYQFKGQHSEEIYNLSGLKNSIYIAKVTLSSGTIISKKVFKK